MKKQDKGKNLRAPKMTKARKALGVLGRVGVEYNEDGVALGRGEGRDNADELGAGRFCQVEAEPSVCDGIIGSV